jgi:histidinol dehydrogenase
MPTGVEDIVAGIIRDVKENGDKALLEYNKKFDHNDSDELEVSAEEIQAAYDSIDPEFISVMEEAAANIRDFHSRQKRNSFIISEKDGIVPRMPYPVVPPKTEYP